MTADEAVALQLNEKVTHPELDVLSSASIVSIWRLLFYIVGKLAEWIGFEFETQKAEIEAAFLYVPFGTEQWYRQKALEFQAGDTLVFDSINFTFGYPAVTPSKQLVTQCAVVADEYEVGFKLATGTQGGLSPLDAVSEAEFKAYMNIIKYAGTRIAIINQSPDLVRLAVAVFFNAERSPDDVIADLKLAATNYLSAMNTTSFGGIFSGTAFIDALQKVSGVTDVVIKSAIGKPSSSSQWLDFDTGLRYQSYAGYVSFENIDSIFTLYPND